MEKTCNSDVIIYHDETKNVPGQNFKGHVLFFVPVRLVIESLTPLFGTEVKEYYPQKEISKQVRKYREKYKFDRKFHFTSISGKTWGYYDRAYVNVMQMAVEALRHKSPAASFFHNPMHCKLAVIFYPNKTDLSLYGDEQKKERKLRHDETVLRMLLKGAAHYLYNETDTVNVKAIIADGDSAHRDFDKTRIIDRLFFDGDTRRTPLRDYVSFTDDASIIHLRSNHTVYDSESEEFMHANLLQVTDLLLGATIRSCYTGSMPSLKIPSGLNIEVPDKKDIVAEPVRKLLAKKERGGGFRNSGHFRSFTVNQVSFESEGVSFREVNPQSPILKDEKNLF